MSVIVFAEIDGDHYKKSSQEAIVYGKKLALSLNAQCIAVSFANLSSSAELGQYGADKVVQLNNSNAFTSDQSADLFAKTCSQLGATVVIVSNTYTGKSLAPRVAVALNASLATNVISDVDLSNGFTVKRGVFSGKAFAYTSLTKDVKVLALTPNSFDLVKESPGASIEALEVSAAASKITIERTEKASGKIPLTEAEIVVSAGRGMKGPENWNMVEELAGLMGAATACSKPVSDMGWRPHSEHVGQTGITIKPNLYVAIGISGAIQHLAGVSSSKTIVAINKDPEAPFFKAADYGIVGDAFEILPKLIQALKN